MSTPEPEAKASASVTEIGYPSADGGVLHHLFQPMREPEPLPEPEPEPEASL